MGDRLTPRGRLVLPAVLAVLALGATACGDDAPPGGTPELEPATAGPVTDDLAGTFDAATTLSRDLGVLRARCLDRQGFPQVLRALELRRPANPDFDQDPLRIAPVEYGPATTEQARTYGMVGTEAAEDPGDVGAVVARDTGFDAASVRCEDWIYDEVAPGLRELQTRAARFQDDVQRDLVGRVGEEMTPLLERRADCLSREYPALTAEAFLEAPSMAAIVELAGVEPGAVRTEGEEPPTRDSLDDGEIVVVAPLRHSYEPTAAEVTLAERYVDCGTEVGFVTAADRAGREQLRAVERSYRTRSDALRPELVAALARLHRPTDG